MKKEKAKSPFYKKWWFWGIVFVLAIMGAFVDDEEVADEPNIEESTTEPEEDKAEEENEADTDEIGKATIEALESNDFYKFVEEYKKLGINKTPVWDEHLNGKKVTWTGTVVRAGTSQLFVYGGNDYSGESWDELGEKEKLFYSFVAKYTEGTEEEFKKLQPGDKITVEGDLESRGDFDLNYNWKIYNAIVK